jgi:hypothetical protein
VLPYPPCFVQEILGNRTGFDIHLGEKIAEAVVLETSAEGIVDVRRELPAAGPFAGLGQDLLVEAQRHF